VRRFLFTIVGFVALLLVASPAYAPPPVLDHFKCYPIRETTSVSEFVELQDQFDTPNFEQVLVGLAVIFCNPSAKISSTGTFPINNPNNHLKMYLIHPGTPAQLPLTVANQFGGQNLTVSSSVLLAVPTQKGTLPPPSGLDHFKCYPARVTPGAVNQPTFPISVALMDQFDKAPEQVDVLRVVAFCNPTVKIHDGQTTTIQNRLDHLACYVFRSTGRETNSPGLVHTNNQFGGEKFSVTRARYLCVPTAKQEISG